jgi:uncharacterized protein
MGMEDIQVPMSSMREIQDFLAQQRFAMVGVSSRPDDFSRALFKEFLKRGYQVVPVHPEARQIEDQPCFARIQDVQPQVDGALLMTSPPVTARVVRDCAEAGLKRVWMYRAIGAGSVDPDAVAFCESRGISVVPGECPLMFLAGGAWIHRFHGFVRKVTGSYPKDDCIRSTLPVE